MTSLHPVLQDQLNLAVKPSSGLAKYTKRDAVLPDVDGKVHAIIGMRRAGKTTFLRQLQAELRAKAAPERAIYLSFDDDRLADVDSAQLNLLLEEYFRRYPEFRGQQEVYWFLDEIQLVEGWERFVRRVVDTERIRVVVSGSSANMLSREIHTSLRGRSMATVISPFSFREFLRHLDEEPADMPGRWTPGKRSSIENRFDAYLRGGGFPEAQGIEARTRVALLQGYVDAVLFRDVVERHEVSQVAALRWLVRYALRNPAGKVSVRRLYDDLRSQGHSVGRNAVGDLLGYVLDAFLIDLVPVAADSERKKDSNPRVVYPVDTGLIQAFDASGRRHVGHALETAVFNELVRRGLDVAYFKADDGSEVDFLSRDYEGNDELIQVCADVSSPSTLERELRAFGPALLKYPQAKPTLLTLNRVSASGLVAPGISVRPAYEWMLGS